MYNSPDNLAVVMQVGRMQLGGVALQFGGSMVCCRMCSCPVKVSVAWYVRVLASMYQSLLCCCLWVLEGAFFAA